jgi:hypothetical protein
LPTIDYQSTWAIGAVLTLAVALIAWARGRNRRPSPVDDRLVCLSPSLPAPGHPIEPGAATTTSGSISAVARARCSRPFSTAQYARLLLWRSRWQAAWSAGMATFPGAEAGDGSSCVTARPLNSRSVGVPADDQAADDAYSEVD